MGKLKNIITPSHVQTRRDYAARAHEEKPKFASIAKNFDHAYWDAGRETGYGGYRDDGRWSRIASRLLDEYEIEAGGCVLDIGCGKGYLLNDLKKARPDLTIRGIDISSYAIAHAPPSVAPHLELGSAQKMDLNANSFDLIVSLNTLHNLELPELISALQSIQRAAKKHSYICVESYRNEKEKWNLMRWQLTCESFFTPREWQWVFESAGYQGDYEFIYFE